MLTRKGEVKVADFGLAMWDEMDAAGRAELKATLARGAKRQGVQFVQDTSVTDMAFDEDVLLDQDKFLTACLRRPEFAKKMTGTELRYKLGARFGEQEQRKK